MPVMGRFNDSAPGRPSANETDEDCGGFDTEADWSWNDRLCRSVRSASCAGRSRRKPFPTPDPTDPMDPWRPGP